MARILISAGHDLKDPGVVALGTTESREMILTRNEIVKELELRGVDCIVVPDSLSRRDTIRWINTNAVPGDVALEIHGNAFNGSLRGAQAFYIYGNDERQLDAQLLLNALLQEIPELPSRGVQPDIHSPNRRGLSFCRQVAVSSVLMQLCFIDNPQDLELLQNQREKFAKGIAQGLIQWSGQTPKTPEFPTINIFIKQQKYDEKGILINSNAFIPVDLVEMLGISLTDREDIRQISYGNVVYVKAVDLQDFNIAASWENQTKTVILNSLPRTLLEDGDQIMGMGNATESQLKSFLEKNNEDGLKQFPDLPRLYIEEAENELVNHDVAFCQMCLETDYLRFGGKVKPEQNNFCGLGTVEASAAGATFPDPKTGVKAHIEHLKAYASTDMINEPPIVDPRFDYVPRGVAPSVYDLGRRWNPDLEYGNQIMVLIKQLYGVF
ncbi:N-acetylmuramoyl-L-alanine amidase [Moorena sp. SIO3A2]|uniref:hormogonium tapered terminus morphoprotein TftA n=2 Tax=unclassified Moorena TaxID=2683338 RepID=UPI0013B69D7C|nr:N-acetylmuramoyl-L-alanine amidase [Moorena sp. SIO3A2]NER86769.1 cell wall hydrolase [Moorena sp. SIO3A2]